MEDVEDLSKMKVADLKKQLKCRNLPVTGNKTELVERLQTALKSDGNPTLNASEAMEEDEFDEEEILGGEDVDIGKITQEEEAAALSGSLRVKDDSLLIPETPPEKKKISLKRSEPVLSVPSEPTTPAVETTTTEPQISTNSKPEKEEATVTAEPKHKAIKLSDPTTEDALEARAKKFGATTTTTPAKPDTDEGRRMARANRFGISATVTPTTNGSSKRAPKLSMETGGTDLEKLKKRAERFGEVTSKSLTKVESLEKLKKRENRFTSGDKEAGEKKTEKEKPSEVDTEAAKLARANRFGSTDEKENEKKDTEEKKGEEEVETEKKEEEDEKKEISTKVAVTAPSNEDDAKKKRTQRFTASAKAKAAAAAAAV